MFMSLYVSGISLKLDAEAFHIFSVGYLQTIIIFINVFRVVLHEFGTLLILCDDGLCLQ